MTEDLFLALPGFGFAVIDGLSDRTGHRYGGLSAGQMAARLVAAETAHWLATDRHNLPQTLIERLTAEIAAAYIDAGIYEVAMAEPGRRFGATLALAIDLGQTWRFLLAGDSGIRLNGSQILQNGHPVDIVTSALRIETYHAAKGHGANDEAAAEVARSVTLNGATELHPGMSPWLDVDDLEAILSRARTRAEAQLFGVPACDIDVLLTQGIVQGQGHFQNNINSPMSYAVIDGTEVPMIHIHIEDRSADSLESIELFTDGYLEPPNGISIAAWEASFATIEAKDPAKIDAHPCPKGSSKERWFDDRTVVIVDLR
ncbi:MAG: hypothetical protein AAGA73_00855 [Pseudomonadota bacterium]